MVVVVPKLASPPSYPVFRLSLYVVNECFMKSLRPASCSMEMYLCHLSRELLSTTTNCIPWITFAAKLHTKDYLLISTAYHGLPSQLNSIPRITFTAQQHTTDYLHSSTAYHGLPSQLNSIPRITFTAHLNTMDYLRF